MFQKRLYFQMVMRGCRRGGAWCCRTLLPPAPALAVPPALKLRLCVGSCPSLPPVQQAEHPEPRSALVVLVPCAEGSPLGGCDVHLPRVRPGAMLSGSQVLLCPSSSGATPLLKHSHLEQAAQDRVQMTFEGCRLHNLPGQPV